MKPKVIKTEADYSEAMARIDELLEAEPGTPEADELELLSTLVELYEKKNYPIDPPDPASAIRFRMEQQGLKPKDLVPYFGSPSKVSEVLSGRRSLSLSMIRNLVDGLGIPPRVLLREPTTEVDLSEAQKFPIGEMVKRGWLPGFKGSVREAREQLENLVPAFLRLADGVGLRLALNRQHIRSGSQMDPYALAAWRIRVASLAMSENLPAYQKNTVTLTFLRELVRLSYLSEGPRLAKEFLNKNGIHLIVEPHLPGTFLDGAAFKLPNGAPVVAVTLRYDRLDSFWFTLCHECAHIGLHLDKDGVEVFFDDLVKSGNDKCEKEADKLATEALIPAKQWAESRLDEKHTPDAVRAFAEKLRISPAIPAGRIRFEKNDYRILKDLVGSGKVRCLFRFSENQRN
jgi:HTH-type transcriptional regulator/antitoxin HigA